MDAVNKLALILMTAKKSYTQLHVQAAAPRP